MAPAKAATISLEDYAALPPSIQRKYFSSTERLRIFQQAAAEKRKKSPRSNTSWLASASTTTLGSVHSTSTQKKLQKRRTLSNVRPTSTSTVNEPFISTDQTDWFINLPEKVKKQHLSQEEQAQLATRSERIVPGISSGYSSEAGEGSSCVPSSSSTSRRSSLDSLDSLDILGNVEEDSSTVASTATEMEIFRLYNRRQSKMLESSSQPHEPKTLIKPPAARKTLRHRLSLVPLPLPPPVLAPRPGAQSPRNFSRPGIQREFSASQSTFLSPDTSYYQDPTTRHRLKHCTASPERFDEAIEFGFPTAIRPVELPDNEYPVRTTSTSWYTEKKDYDTDSFESSGPTTPTAATSDCSPTVDRLSSFSDDDSHNTRDHRRTNDNSDMPSSPSASSACFVEKREMTLRMTLTKSGLLRSPNEDVCAWQTEMHAVGGDDEDRDSSQAVQADPLALERLPVVSEDATGAGGAFALQQRRDKRLGRMFKGLKV